MNPVCEPVIPSNRISLSSNEIDAVAKVLGSGTLCGGEELPALEDEFQAFLGRCHAVAVATGTAALHLSLLALGVAGGDEVIVPSYVCSAVLNAVRYVGAQPVLCDICEGGCLMDPSSARRLLSPRTRGIIVPEMFGYRADVAALDGLGAPIVLDEAMSLGSARSNDSLRRPLVSTFSFYATKVIASGQGGLVATDDERIAFTVRDLKEYDRKGDGKLRYNYDLTAFQCALARKQLGLLAQRIQRRKAVAALFSRQIDNPFIGLPPEPAGWNYQRYILTVQGGADPFIRHLEKAGIRTVRPVFKPLHRLLGLDAAGFPHTERAWDEQAALPCFPDLSDAETARIIAAVNSYEGAV